MKHLILVHCPMGVEKPRSADTSQLFCNHKYLGWRLILADTAVYLRNWNKRMIFKHMMYLLNSSLCNRNLSYVLFSRTIWDKNFFKKYFSFCSFSEEVLKIALVY